MSLTRGPASVRPGASLASDFPKDWEQPLGGQGCLSIGLRAPACRKPGSGEGPHGEPTAG